MSAKQLRLSLIGFGEAGSLIASGLAQEGLTGIAAIDPALADPSRAWLRETAADANIHLFDDAAELAEYDVVFVLVPPKVAIQVASQYAAKLRPGALYVDLTSCGPKQKQEVARVVAAAGRDFIDAAMVGSVPVSRHRIPVVACGPRAQEFHDLFTPYGMDIKVVEGEIGSAAGIKIVRSILAKGVEALFAEALVVARRYGIEDEVLGSFADFMDQHTMRAHAQRMLRAHIIHAGRRAEEVRMSVEAVRDAGIDPVLTQAIVDVLDRTAATGIAARYGGKQPATYEEALDALNGALGSANENDTEGNSQR